MSSPESHIIREFFERPTQSNTTPISIQRQEWEAATANDPLPDQTTIDSQTIADIPCERITCGTIDNNKLLIYIHGGGFVVGSLATHRKLGAYLSKVTGMPILMVSYRLAPENPFPCGLDDVVAVYQAVLEQGYDASQLILCGDSAGGGLAVSSVLKLRDMGIPLPAASVLISPWLDLAVEGESITSRQDHDPFITDFNLRETAQYYVNDDQLKDPLVSPIYADLTGLPPFLIHVGDHEILLSDSTRFATKAKTAGVDVTLEVWDEMWHVWHSHVPDLPEALEAIDKIGDFIKAIDVPTGQ